MAIRDRNAGAWYHRGQALCSDGRFDEAVACYDRALELSPGDPLLWKRRGFALIKAGRYREAAASFDRALALDPDDTTAWQRKGYALACLGWSEDAVACCDEALMRDPEHILAWQSRGWVLGIMCRYDEAAACYEEVVRLDPSRGSAVWHRERMQERRDLEALATEIREAERFVEVPACIRDVVRERDYGNVALARAVLQELVGRAERPAVQRR
jgi:tetratricopeptide (TPR) repeat protein